MKKRLLLTMTALVMATTAMLAVPAKPGTKKTVKLSDGSTVELTLKGDEHYSYYINEAGKPCQVVNGRLQLMTSQEITDEWTARKSARLQAADSRRAARRIGTPGTTLGKQRGLVILIQYPDVQFVTKNPQQAFSRFFNEEGYNENGMCGSVRDYFLKQSYGKLQIDFDVVGPYTTKQNMAYYGAPVRDENGKVTQHDVMPDYMIAEAVDAASKEVDFSKYDWNGDGEVNQVFVIYAGYAEAQGADENCIWPHEYHLRAAKIERTYNGKIIDTYGCTAELRGDGKTDTGIMDGIGTACHEFSHCLGLPDMYDTRGNEADNYGMGSWDVMDYGSYNDNARTPAGYTAYERWFAKWLEPVEIKTLTRINGMKPLATSSEAYVLYNDGNRDEYYLLENRQPIDFDKGLYGHGLLIYHVDYNEAAWSNNKVNSTARHPRMAVVPAGNRAPRTLNEIAGDPWPGIYNNTMLANYTSPSAMLYNVNTDGSLFLNKSIDNITEDTEAKTVSFVACRKEMVPPAIENAAASGDKSFTISWGAVSGATGYEIELTEFATAPTDPKKALVKEFDFSGCVSKSAGFSDISSKLSQYGLTGWYGSKLYTTPNKLRIGTSSATGFLRTPTWNVPASTEMTVLLGANIVKEETPVKGNLVLYYGNAKESASTETIPFEVTDDQTLLFQFTVRKDLFYFEIVPESQLYITYFAYYDGTWSLEQLGLQPVEASRRSAKVNVYTTTTNSYTFTDVNTANRFVYRVRALGEENTFSAWTDEKTFEFGTAGISGVTMSDSDSPVHYFDLQGRKVDATTRGLLIRRQGNDVRKVIIR